MKIKLHGAANEVGRSCVEVVTKQSRVLLDAGIKFSVGLGGEETQFPVDVKNLNALDAVFLSHAHLDHSGALPLFDHQGLNCPIFATNVTKAISKLLLKDAFKIGRLKHEHLGYVKDDIAKALDFFKKVKQKEFGKIKDIGFEFVNAGHIPGSCSILLKQGSSNLLYTGDFNTLETELMKGARLEVENIKTLIIEATYGDRDHPSREETEKDFIGKIKETLENKGSVIIPVFAVGRAQEIMLILDKYQFDVPIWLDGSAKDATEIILRFPESVKDSKKLSKAFGNIDEVKGFKQRQSIVKEQGIFVTTAGMLSGGPVIDYLKNLNSSRNSILITGYQGEDTNGRMLLEKGKVILDRRPTEIFCKYYQFDFSAHSGQPQLKETVRKLNPENIIINHGDRQKVEALHEWCSALGYNVFAPELGDVIKL